MTSTYGCSQAGSELPFRRKCTLSSKACSDDATGTASAQPVPAVRLTTLAQLSRKGLQGSMRVVVAALVALAALAGPGAATGVAPTHPAGFARLRGGNQQPAFGRSGDKGGRKGAFKIAVHATLTLILRCAVACGHAGLSPFVPCLHAACWDRDGAGQCRVAIRHLEKPITSDLRAGLHGMQASLGDGASARSRVCVCLLAASVVGF